MNRFVYVVLLASAILLLSLMIAPSSGTGVQAQSNRSAGCEEVLRVFVPGSFISSGDSLSATGDFVVGDAITLLAELDAGAIPSNVSFEMTGPSGTSNASGSLANFFITVAGVHTITVTNGETATIVVTSSCPPIQRITLSAIIPPWEGFSDGRLSADPAEVYSVWCEYGFLKIYYQFNGVTFLANEYPMDALTDLSVGGTAVTTDQNTGDELRIVRYARERYEIFGPRGNKFFRIDSCFDDVVPAPPGDNDADGVPDNQDACPDWTGFARWGCPDTDNDGLIDPVDSCPVIEGPLEFGGCPPDNPNADKDGDGIRNFLDACPDFVTPEGVIDRQGCPDWDGDGVTNSPKVGYAGQDHCPLVAGSPLNSGCPGTRDWIQRVDEVEGSSIDLFEFAQQTGNFNEILVDVNTRETTCIITSTSFLICDPDFMD